MSEPAPNPPTPASRGGVRLVAIGLVALVLGVLAGALALYVIETRSGNEALAGTDATCPVAKAFTDAVNGSAKGEIAAVQALDEPFDARAIAFEREGGAAATLGDFSGRALLVNLWATWCLPCRAEMPALDALEREKGGADFAVLPINVDLGDIDKPKGFYADAKIGSLPLLRDPSMGVFNDLKAKGVALGLPVTLLVDAKGCARAVLSGPAEWASPDAIRLVDAVRKADL